MITEVRIKLMEDGNENERLQAFCSVTFDNAFVVRDLKIIEGTNGPFVAMPSRKLTSRCAECGCKNHLRASYCNQCGTRQHEERMVRDAAGRTKLYADIAHPINAACRELIQSRVVQEFQNELERAKQPGYVSRYDEYDLDDDFEDAGEAPAATSDVTAERPPERSSRGVQTKLEPAQQPHGPHKRRSHARGEPRLGGAKDFGAGIF